MFANDIVLEIETQKASLNIGHETLEKKDFISTKTNQIFQNRGTIGMNYGHGQKT